jgi:hypothetical protein
MTMRNALRSLAKHGDVHQSSRSQASVRIKNEIVEVLAGRMGPSFTDEEIDESQVIVRWRSANDHDDIQSDYFAGVFMPSLKSALDAAHRFANREAQDA